MSLKIERPAAVAGANAVINAGQANLMPAVFTVPQTAKMLQVSEKTIWNALAQGRLFSVYVLGTRRIPYEEIRRIAMMGTFWTAEEIAAHYERVNPENCEWAKQELARRQAARSVEAGNNPPGFKLLPETLTPEQDMEPQA